MRTGITLCTHLWRNAVLCDEALVVADAQEDQGFDRTAEITEELSGDGGARDGFWLGQGDEDGEGDGNGYCYGKGEGGGAGDGGGGIGNGHGDGDGGNFASDYEYEVDPVRMGDGGGEPEGHGHSWGNLESWSPNHPYPFPNEALEVSYEPE